MAPALHKITSQEELEKMSPETILRETQSLYQFKVGLRLFLEKYKSRPMTEKEYREATDPLAVRAFRDGRAELAELLRPYLGV